MGFRGKWDNSWSLSFSAVYDPTRTSYWVNDLFGFVGNFAIRTFPFKD